MFEKSKLSLKMWLHLLYNFSMQTGAVKTSNLLGLNVDTVSIAFATLRGFITIHLEQNPIMLGGFAKELQIDESCWSHTGKYHKGKARSKKPVWVFGIVDTTVRPCVGYMEIVSHRDKKTLYPILQKRCIPGSRIYSDEWAAYRKVYEELGFDHETVNHSKNFVNPLTGVHTQAI